MSLVRQTIRYWAIYLQPMEFKPRDPCKEIPSFTDYRVYTFEGQSTRFKQEIKDINTVLQDRKVARIQLCSAGGLNHCELRTVSFWAIVNVIIYKSMDYGSIISSKGRSCFICSLCIIYSIKFHSCVVISRHAFHSYLS